MLKGVSLVRRSASQPPCQAWSPGLSPLLQVDLLSAVGIIKWLPWHVLTASLGSLV